MIQERYSCPWAENQRAENEHEQALVMINILVLFFYQYIILLNGVLVAVQQNVDIFSFW